MTQSPTNTFHLMKQKRIILPNTHHVMSALLNPYNPKDMDEKMFYKTQMMQLG